MMSPVMCRNLLEIC